MTAYFATQQPYGNNQHVHVGLGPDHMTRVRRRVQLNVHMFVDATTLRNMVGHTPNQFLMLEVVRK